MDAPILLSFPKSDVNQARIDSLESQLHVLTIQQVEQLMDLAYQYLIKVAEAQEGNEEDSTFATNALSRMAEASYWVANLSEDLSKELRSSGAPEEV